MGQGLQVSKCEDECIFCSYGLEADIDNVLLCPICVDDFIRKRTKIPLDNIKEKYETIYLTLTKIKKEMDILKKSKKLTKNKEGFMKGFSAIETIIKYMDDFK